MNTTRFDTNRYEFNPDSRKGCYIIHGFTSTTYETRELAEFLGENGFHTVTENLPGHATTSQECNRVKYQDWLSFIDRKVAEFSTECDELYVVGMSMGGVLAMYAADLFPLKAVVAAASVFRFADHYKLKFFNSVLCSLFPMQSKLSSYDKSIRDNLIFFGYKEYPMKALNEFRKMNKLVLQKLNNISCPALIMHAENDKTSMEININLITDRIGSEKISVKRYAHASHNIFIQSDDQKQIFQDILIHLNTV